MCSAAVDGERQVDSPGAEIDEASGHGRSWAEEDVSVKNMRESVFVMEENREYFGPRSDKERCSA